MTIGFSTKDKEINALLDELHERTDLPKTTIVKRALRQFREAQDKFDAYTRWFPPDRQPHTHQEER